MNPASQQPPSTRLRRVSALPVVVIAALLLGAFLVFRALPQRVQVSGESESSTDDFRLSARRYALSAEVLPQCQYTFYLTPRGQLWNRAGKAIASVSGETEHRIQTDPLDAGRYFVHAFTAPEEGCSWTLKLTPL